MTQVAAACCKPLSPVDLLLCVAYILYTLADSACRSAPESEDSPVQNAVVRVFDRIVDASNPGLEPAQVFIGRMLLRPPQVGSALHLLLSSHSCLTSWWCQATYAAVLLHNDC